MKKKKSCSVLCNAGDELQGFKFCFCPQYLNFAVNQSRGSICLSLAVYLVYCSAAKSATEWRKKAGPSRGSRHSFNRPDILHHHDIGVWVLYHRSYRGTVPYQLQLWALTTAIICNAKTVLSAPACSQAVGPPFCLTPCLDEISEVHAPAPQGNSRRYGYYANYSDGAKGGQ